MIKRICTLLCCLLFLSFPAAADYQSELSAFPSAWQTKLAALHKKYPNWVFVAVPTHLDWDTVVKAETGKKSLVEKYYSTLLRNHAAGHYNAGTGTYTYHDASVWLSASSAVVDYFMNPANFLNEQHIFMFEALSYDKTYHTKDGVELILNGTFMHDTPISYLTATGETVTTEKTYAEVIMEAAQKSGVSPYYLASKIRTEIGIKPSGSVSGSYGDFKGIYNFYNIGANDGKNPIANGLNWASLGTSYGRPWTTPEASIINGAVWIGELYISKGQNTMYFERFNVAPKSGYALYTHQYMTNVYGAVGQAQSIFTGYQSAGTLSDAKVFYIPVFSNMPAADTAVTFSAVNAQTATSSGGVNVRRGPSTNTAAVGTLTAGQTFTILSGTRTSDSMLVPYLKNPYWYKIQYSGGTGYISAEYASLIPSVRLAVGEKFSLLPAATNGSGKLYWENTNANAVTISPDGTLSAKAGGTAVVRAYTSGGGMATVYVAVTDSFTDMIGHWATDVVDKVCDMGLFSGTSETTFSPDTSMTRAMFITVLGRLHTALGSKTTGDIAALPYLDIDESAWYAPYVAWGYENGLLSFAEGSIFSPSAPITRFEMVASMYSLAEKRGANLTGNRITAEAYSDFVTLSPYEKTVLQWAVTKEIIRGMGDGTLSPSQTATRAQVAQIMINAHTFFSQ